MPGVTLSGSAYCVVRGREVLCWRGLYGIRGFASRVRFLGIDDLPNLVIQSI
jgi:hypothetical protein